jgi:hypothetical protein
MIYLISRLSHLCMRRKKQSSQTIKNKSYQENDQSDQQYKQSCLQLSRQEPHHLKINYNNLSVLTVEDPMKNVVRR